MPNDKGRISDEADVYLDGTGNPAAPFPEQREGDEGVKGPDRAVWPDDQDHSIRPDESYEDAELKGPDPAVWPDDGE